MVKLWTGGPVCLDDLDKKRQASENDHMAQQVTAQYATSQHRNSLVCCIDLQGCGRCSQACTLKQLPDSVLTNVIMSAGEHGHIKQLQSAM